MTRVDELRAVALAALFLTSCTNPIEKARQVGYDRGFEAGHEAGLEDGVEQGKEEGKSEALDCVRGEENSPADEAADSCD
jgi:flagellar biosynthesis/type III secretory pathway protein FliH